MGDAYVEQLIKKEAALGQTALRVGAIVSGLLITYILIIFIGIISLVGAFAIGYGIYYLFLMTDIEYEYIYVNGELSIDTIYGKNKRKKAGVYDLKKCELIAPINNTFAAGYHRNTQMKTYDFTSGKGEDGVFLIVVGYGAGNAKVYFEPNQELLVAMKNTVPGKLKSN